MVESHEVSRTSIVAEVMGTGTLEARIQATISPKISGLLDAVLVDQGDQVEAGQLLAQLDDRELAQQVKVAEATVAAAEATLGRYRAEEQQAESAFQQAESEYRRLQRLREANAVSDSELDQAQEAFESSRAGVARASAALLEAQQQIALAGESLKFQQTRLADTRLRAPFDGLVIKRHKDAGAIAVPGSPLLDLISMDELWVSAWVDETEMGRLRDEQPARVVFRSEAGQEFSGTVARLGKQADRETREFVVEVRVLQLPENWAIGQRAEVFITVARREDALAVPESFVHVQAGQTGVFVEEDATARWRPVQLGLQGQGQVEILKGIEQGDTILAMRSSRPLRDGEKVQTQ
jgi:HlyD family secretion protein